MSARERLVAFVRENMPENGLHDPGTGRSLYREAEWTAVIDSVLDGRACEIADMLDTAPGLRTCGCADLIRSEAGQ